MPGGLRTFAGRSEFWGAGGKFRDSYMSWRQRIANLGDATEKLYAPNDARANRTVSRLILEDPRERTGV